MDTTTINGLHSCKPGNEPTEGQIKTFVVEQRTSKQGKPWLKIKSAGPDFGGTPFRILSAAPTGFIDQHGNHSFNLEIEPAVVNGQSEIRRGEQGEPAGWEAQPKPHGDPPQRLASNAPAPPARPYAETVGCATPTQTVEDGVAATRKHLMQSVNLYNLCVDAVDTCVKPHINNMDAELYQAAIGTLFIEASHKRTNDGINWWSYVDKMPTAPINKAKLPL